MDRYMQDEFAQTQCWQFMNWNPDIEFPVVRCGLIQAMSTAPISI